MSRESKAIPGIAKGDNVWVRCHGDDRVRPGRVSRIYTSAPEMFVAVLDSRGRPVETVFRMGADEGRSWWRTEADAAGPARQGRRAEMVRTIEYKRRMLAEAEAKLAAFDAEERP